MGGQSMRRPRMDLGERDRGSPIQYFTYGPFEFNINKANLLSAYRKKYRPVSRRPMRDWIGPFIDINEDYIERTNIGKPVIFATIILDGQLQELLIDGNHRVL